MKKIVMYILLISLMFLIFFFSSQPSIESTKTSSTITNTIITVFETISDHKFSVDERQKVNDYLTTPIRKCAHFTLYFLLGIILYNLLILYKIDYKKRIYLIILFCTLYACMDEIHQLFVFGRSGEIKDVFIDFIGSLLGLMLCLKISKNKNIKIKNN